jgi:hypothetical protein
MELGNLSAYLPIVGVGACVLWAGILWRPVKRLFTHVRIPGPDGRPGRAWYPTFPLSSGGRWAVWAEFEDGWGRLVGFQKLKWGPHQRPLSATLAEFNEYHRAEGYEEITAEQFSAELALEPVVPTRSEKVAYEQRLEETLARLLTDYRRARSEFWSRQLPRLLIPFLALLAALGLAARSVVDVVPSIHGLEGLPLALAIAALAMVAAFPWLIFAYPHKPTYQDADIEMVGEQYRATLRRRAAGGEGQQ